MTRPIELRDEHWCSRKDAWTLTGRSLSTIDRLRRAGIIRERWHRVRGLELYIPDMGLGIQTLPERPAEPRHKHARRQMTTSDDD